MRWRNKFKLCKWTIKTALEQYANKLDISDQVIFTGFVPDEELPYFYKLSKCFIIASIAELLSLVTLQAMASGLPIIAVNAGALSELVKDKINGYLYREGDIPAIIQAIEDIFSHDDICRNMGEKSLEFAKQHDIYKTLESFEILYKLSCAWIVYQIARYSSYRVDFVILFVYILLKESILVINEQECTKILNEGEFKFTHEEILQIREFLSTLALI